MELSPLIYTLPQYVLFFFVYGILGWCGEVAFAAIKLHSLVNRGFLNGPICPIYGFGMLSLIVFLGPLAGNLVYLFVGGMFITTAIELFGGWALFHVFHTRWWDYSENKWNLGGYICPKFTLAWGAGSVVMMRVIHPLIALPVVHIPLLPLLIVNGVLLIGFVADAIVSACEAVGLNKHLRELDSMRDAMRVTSNKLTEIIGTNTMTFDELMDQQKLQMTLAAMEGRDNAAELKEQLLALAKRGHALQDEGQRYGRERFFGTGRLMRAFPQMKSMDHAEALAEFRDRLAETTTDFAKLLGRTAKTAATKVKDTAETAATKVKDTAETAATKVKDTAETAATKVKDTAEIAATKVKDTAETAATKVKDTAETAATKVKDTAETAATKVKDTAGSAAAKVKTTAGTAAAKLSSRKDGGDDTER